MRRFFPLLCQEALQTTIHQKSSLNVTHAHRPLPEIKFQPQKTIVIRRMTFEDFNLTLNWAAKEGWNPGRYEAKPLYEADPEGCRILLVDEEPVATIVSVRYSNEFAFMGLYIVNSQYRGFGYGKLLCDFAMSKLESYKTIGINGVLEQTKNYTKIGFKPSKLNTRFNGVTRYGFFGHKEQPLQDCVFLSQDYSMPSIIDYDAKIFGAPRETLLSEWLKMPGSHVLTATQNGQVKGYGVVSRCVNNGYKIAPLFADSISIAEQLYHGLSRIIGDNAVVQLDVTESNPSAISLAKHLGLQENFQTLRMYKGEFPSDCEEKDHKTFGLTSLEIG